MKLTVEEITVTIKRREAVEILNILHDSALLKREIGGDNKAAFELRNLLNATFISSTLGIHRPD